MEIHGIFFFLIIALLLTSVFSFVFKVRGPWGSFWTFFIVLFFAIVASNAWITPFGPYRYDIYFVPPLAVGLLVSLILAAATPAPQTRNKIEEEIRDTDKYQVVNLALNSFFWIMLIFLLAAIIAGIFI